MCLLLARFGALRPRLLLLLLLSVLWLRGWGRLLLLWRWTCWRYR